MRIRRSLKKKRYFVNSLYGNLLNGHFFFQKPKKEVMTCYQKNFERLKMPSRPKMTLKRPKKYRFYQYHKKRLDTPIFQATKSQTKMSETYRNDLLNHKH